MVTLSKGRDRRAFLKEVTGYAALGVAAVMWPGCDAAMQPLIGEMAGPVRVDEKYYRMPAADSATALFAPYGGDKLIEPAWSIARLSRGYQDQLIVVLIDVDTEGQAELEIYAAEKGPRPLARAGQYHIHLNDGARGDRKTPEHLERLAHKIAEISDVNRERVDLAWPLATHREAQAKRFARKS
jgi:hypothetical protein